MNTFDELRAKLNKSWKFRFWYAVYWPQYQLIRFKYKLKRDGDMDKVLVEEKVLSGGSAIGDKVINDVGNAIWKRYFFKADIVSAMGTGSRVSGYVSVGELEGFAEAWEQTLRKTGAYDGNSVYIFELIWRK